MITRRDAITMLATGAAWGPGPAAVQAQAWPAQTLRFVVPYPPGGATDIVARIYGQALQQELGQAVVVDNRAGAGGEIGAEFVARAPADGHTLLFGAIGSLAIHAAIPSQRPAYALAKAFSGVSMGASVPLALVVRQTLGVDSLPELIRLAQAQPGRLSYGSAGNGSAQHMTVEYFRQRTGVDLVHVPYKGSAPAISDLLGGQIDMVIDTLPALTAHLGNPRLRVLAVTSSRRSPSLPQTPTMEELEIQGFDVSTLYGLLAPRATPEAIVEQLSAAMRRLGARADIQAQMLRQGADARTSTPRETDAILRSEVEKWSAVARLAGLD